MQNPNLGMFDVLVGIVVFQYFFIAAFLLGLRRNGRYQAANIYLASFFCLVAINLIDAGLMIHGGYRLVPGLALLEDSLVLTYGPILYFYTLHITSPDRKRSAKDLTHFIPALILLLAILSFYTIKDESEKLVVIDAIMQQQLPVKESLFSFSTAFIHFFTYLILATQRIKKYHRSLRDQFSSLEKKNVAWLSFTLRTLGATFLLSWFSTFMSILHNDKIAQLSIVGVVLIMLYYINSFVIRALKDNQLFSEVEVPFTESKNARQRLGQTEIDDIGDRLYKAMNQQKLYRDAGLTIDKLSESIGTPNRKLSQYLNEIAGQNFFDYINGWRIEEAKVMLLDRKDQKTTVQEVMYRVGFISKSSFNTLFKEKTGKTPSQYRKDGLSS